MNTNQLEHFLTLVETLNYTTASAKLDISQPGLYRSIAALEEELDATLFEKKGRNIVLSKGGEIFSPHAKIMLDQLHAACAELQILKKSVVHPINIAVAIDYDINLFGAILNSYMQQTNNKFSITQIQLPDIITLLKNNDVDFAFSCLSQILIREQEFDFARIKPDKYCCFMHKDNALASKSSIQFKDLHDQVFIFYSEYAQTAFSERMKRRGYDLIAYPGVFSKDAVFALIEEGAGVCIAGKSSQYNKENIVAVDLEDDFADFYIGFTWKKNRQFSDEALNFRKFVLQNYALKNEEQ